MADRDSKAPFVLPDFDPEATRRRVIRQRNIALGLALAFFVVLFFAITVVKMKHIQMPHKPPQTAAATHVMEGMNGQ